MNSSSTSVRNASILVYGAVLFVIIANYLMLDIGQTLNPASRYSPLIPGFWYLPSICYGLLFFWAGLLVRTAFPENRLRWWVQVPVLAFSLFFLFRYMMSPDWFSVPYFYLSLVFLGFTLPLESMKTAGNYRGWYLLALLLVLTFCYVAVAVLNNRLAMRVAFRPQFDDMWRMMHWLASKAEPLMLIVTICLASVFAFTKTGQWIGGQNWFKWLTVILCAVSFVHALVLSIQWHGTMYYTLRFLVHPVSIWLLVAIYWKIWGRNVSGGRLSWKECLRI